MSGIHKILVPVDFSTCSRHALEHATELAERYFGAAVDVLHVWENARSPGQEQASQVQALKDMEALLAAHEAKGIVRFTRLHEIGETVPVILEVARRGSYDLVVMGTHGRTGIAHDHLGSTAEKVVRRAPCPVLTVRERKTSAAAPATMSGGKQAGGT